MSATPQIGHVFNGSCRIFFCLSFFIFIGELTRQGRGWLFGSTRQSRVFAHQSQIRFSCKERSDSVRGEPEIPQQALRKFCPTHAISDVFDVPSAALLCRSPRGWLLERNRPPRMRNYSHVFRRIFVQAQRMPLPKFGLLPEFKDFCSRLFSTGELAFSGEPPNTLIHQVRRQAAAFRDL